MEICTQLALLKYETKKDGLLMASIKFKHIFSLLDSW